MLHYAANAQVLTLPPVVKSPPVIERQADVRESTANFPRLTQRLTRGQLQGRKKQKAIAGKA
jgi:hypothetical protein